MSELPLIYEQAPTTDRPAELLAVKHGYENLAKLAESLPPHAKLLDVGAGASPFGKEVATLRPDISWTNFDYSYNDPKILRDIEADSPANVTYLAGDATRLDENFAPETFDATFSYWLLPHLSIDSVEPAAAAARSMYAVTKTGGTISVGPKASQKRLPSRKLEPALRLVKDASMTAEQYGETIVAATKLAPVTRYAQKLANEVATPFFGTTRYTKHDKGKWAPQIYSPAQETYISSLSRSGIKTMGKLALRLATHAMQQRK